MRMIKLMRLCFIGFACLFSAQTAYLIIDGLTDELGSADAIVILGCKVNLNGSPSNRLKARLNRGYDLYKQGLSRKIVVSGGIGKEGYSEARVMADYLIGLGVPASDIFLDENAKNTRQTAIFAKRLAKDHGFQSVLVVSQYFHITRTKLAFRKQGFENIYSAHAHMFPELRDIYSVPREVVGLLFYFLKKG